MRRRATAGEVCRWCARFPRIITAITVASTLVFSANDVDAGAERTSSAQQQLPARSNDASIVGASPESSQLASRDQIEIWYLKNLRAIYKNTTNAIFALLDAGITDDTQFNAQKERIKKAEDAATAEVENKKTKLLDDLKKTPKGVPAPPIFKVRSEKEHLEEIQKSLGGGK